MLPLQGLVFDAELVGTAGFEPATPCTPSKCATGLRYVPNLSHRQYYVLLHPLHPKSRPKGVPLGKGWLRQLRYVPKIPYFSFPSSS